MNIEAELDLIYRKYDIYQYKDYICELIYEIIRPYLNLSNIAIAGGGIHTKHFLKDFRKFFTGTISIIDKDPEKLKGQPEYINIDLLNYDTSKNFDVIIIGSMEHRESIKEQLTNIDAIKILDIYDELASQGINIEQVLQNKPMGVYFGYYGLKFDSKIFGGYPNLIMLQNLYHQAVNRQSKEIILRYIISGFLLIKDFENAKQWSNHYIEEYKNGSELYIKLFQEIDQLLGKINDITKSRRQRDIICFWHDALRYEVSCEIPFLNECRNKGMDFKQAYTASIATRSVYGAIFESTDEISLYKYGHTTNKVVELLESNQYSCYQIGNSCNAKRFAEFQYAEGVLFDPRLSLTEEYWELLKLLTSSVSPVFVLMHTFIETHPPFCTPLILDYQPQYAIEEACILSQENKCKFELAIRKAAKYVGQQDSFFDKFFSSKSVRIIMSDHGTYTNYKTRQFFDEASHIPLIVVGDHIPHLSVEGLFNNKNFISLIRYILCPEEICIQQLTEEYMAINGIDAYNEDWIDLLIKTKMAKFGLSFQGVQTLTERYILDATGEESYYLLPDEETNHIHNPCYQGRIEDLKQYLKMDFTNINDAKFQKSKKIYEALGKMRKF